MCGSATRLCRNRHQIIRQYLLPPNQSSNIKKTIPLKKLLFLSIAILCIYSSSFATIRRVGFSGPSVNGIDFPDITAAVNASNANDTIQVYPGVGASGINGSQISGLNKPLVFIGFGYLFDLNTGYQTFLNNNDARLFVTNTMAGASGSVFEGLNIINYNQGYGSFNQTSAALGNLKNILFKRCQISQLSSSPFINLLANDTISNIEFNQCILTPAASYGLIFNASGAGSKILGLKFKSCIINGGFAALLYFNNTGSGSAISNVLFEGCNINYTQQWIQNTSLSCYFRSCIIPFEPNQTNNHVFDYCTFSSTGTTHPYVSGTSNSFNVYKTNIYRDTVNYAAVGSIYGNGHRMTDSTNLLVSGSPCLSSGRDYSGNAIQAGAFGGADPYRISGVPRVPNFYRLTSPSAVANSNSYPITFSIKSTN